MNKTRSPCVGICILKADTCTGCGRTVDEIASWIGLNTQQRLQILKRTGNPLYNEYIKTPKPQNPKTPNIW